MNEQTRALLISPIRFDNAPQNYHNTAILTDAIHKRITKKARHPKLQRVTLPGTISHLVV